MVRTVRLFTAIVFGWLLRAQTAALPARFDLTPPQPSICKPAQRGHFLEAVGRRAAILGDEDGTFEAWVNPIKLARDFRLSVFLEGSLDPIDLADLAETVCVSPGRVTVTSSHAAFTVRQTWAAAVAEPALLVLLDIDTDRPLRLRASFIPEMKPMWPASFGGQSSSWDEKERAFILSEGLRRYAPAIGSPLFSTHSEQIGHQLPGRRIVAEMEAAPETTRGHLIPIVLAGSRESYRSALADCRRIVAESDEYYRAFDARTLHIHTPDETLSDAMHWAKFAIEKGWACNDGVGCGLVAGYGPSGETERPGFAWYFGGDALMNSWSVTDYGDFARARAILEFVRNHQRADGKMEHELTQSAALIDWSQYPYGYYHADTTPLYIYSVWRYVHRSGDREFLRASWPSIEKAYAYCVTVLDGDGLLSNVKAGAGAVETGALSGRVANDIYLQGVWLAALDGLVRLAELAGKPAADAGVRLGRARETLNQWFVDARNTFAFARLTDGSIYPAQSAWQGMALAFGGLAAGNAGRAAAGLARAELTTDWGMRLFATDSPNYDPLSYNDGSVWPFVTGFAILAQYVHHQPAAGLRQLYGLAAMTGLRAAGFIPEYMSGERAQALPHAVPHQLFSSAAVINPTISGMLGLDGDGVNGRLVLSPHIPQNWAVRFDGYRVGRSVVAGEIRRARGEARVSLSVSGEPLDVTISPAFAAGTRVRTAEWNGSPTTPETASGVDVHATVRAAAVSRGEALIVVDEPAESSVELHKPSPGDRSAPR